MNGADITVERGGETVYVRVHDERRDEVLALPTWKARHIAIDLLEASGAVVYWHGSAGSARNASTRRVARSPGRASEVFDVVR